MKRKITSTTWSILSWKSKVTAQLWRGTSMRKLEDKHYIRKSDRMLWPGPAKWKRGHSGRIRNIKEFQDHEHTISEENREEIDMEKPWRKHSKWIRLQGYIMTDKPSMVTDVTTITRVNIGSDQNDGNWLRYAKQQSRGRSQTTVYKPELTPKWFERRSILSNSI